MCRSSPLPLSQYPADGRCLAKDSDAVQNITSMEQVTITHFYSYSCFHIYSHANPLFSPAQRRLVGDQGYQLWAAPKGQRHPEPHSRTGFPWGLRLVSSFFCLNLLQFTANPVLAFTVCILCRYPCQHERFVPSNGHDYPNPTSPWVTMH